MIKGDKMKKSSQEIINRLIIENDNQRAKIEQLENGIGMRIEVTTKELYDNMFASFKDIYWDDLMDGTPFLKITAALAKGDMVGIREAFNVGDTPMLLGNKMQELEAMNEKEILILHNNKIIGVLVDWEIGY
jgi:hypothetical protein